MESHVQKVFILFRGNFKILFFTKETEQKPSRGGVVNQFFTCLKPYGEMVTNISERNDLS